MADSAAESRKPKMDGVEDAGTGAVDDEEGEKKIAKAITADDRNRIGLQG